MEKSKKSLVKPNLSLIGEYSRNAIDPSSSEAWSDSSTDKHPAWVLGLKFSMPLGFDKEKAEYLEAHAQRVRAEAQYNAKKDDLRVGWVNHCADLDRLQRAVNNAQEAFQKQRSRERLEERRFQLGRSSTFAFIQAGDDAHESELFLSQQEVELRKSAWNILRLGSRIPKILEGMAQVSTSKKESATK
jgi:outer membrane protein TolC